MVAIIGNGPSKLSQSLNEVVHAKALRKGIKSHLLHLADRETLQNINAQS